MYRSLLRTVYPLIIGQTAQRGLSMRNVAPVVIEERQPIAETHALGHPVARPKTPLPCRLRTPAVITVIALALLCISAAPSKGQPVQLGLSLNKAHYFIGDQLTLSMTALQDTSTSGDLYLIVQAPGGHFLSFDGTTFNLFFDGTNVFQDAFRPFQPGMTLSAGTQTLFAGSLPPGTPVGAYTVYVLLVQTGLSGFDPANWLSGVSEVLFTLDLVPLPGDRLYTGSGVITTTQCDQDDGFSFLASGRIILKRSEDTLNANGSFRTTREGIGFAATFNLAGTISPTGNINGTYTETFSGDNGFHSNGVGTFSGSVTPSVLHLEFSGTATDTLGGTCKVESTFTGSGPRGFFINVTTFIPYSFGVPAFPFLFNGMFLEVTGKGDSRDFDSSENSSYRTRQLITVVTEGENLIVGGPFNLASSTELYVFDLLGMNNPTRLTQIPTSTAGMNIAGPFRIAEDTIRVDFSGSVRSGALDASLSIDWCYSIVIKNPLEGVPTYHIVGGNDNYPAYEVYIDGKAIHQASPPINNIFLLIGSCMESPVDKSGSLDP